MANLKELRNKIGVIQSTRKVTSAMKLVAGVKLRKAEQKASASREYASELECILSKLHRNCLDANYEIFSGRDRVCTQMFVVFASDKGLCGNFNYTIHKEVSRMISETHTKKRNLHIICVGTKLFDVFVRGCHPNDVIELANDFYKDENLFGNSQKLAKKIIDDFVSHKVDKVSVIYMRCISALQRKVEVKDIIPLAREFNPDKTVTIFEPNVDEIMNTIVPFNIAIQIYQSALESVASEQSSRMTSMDNATRNADDLLSSLTIKYNRTRQYSITQELVEVVSGAAAIVRG